MSKSQKTYELEEIITLATSKPNRVGCPEVGLGDYGIVDYISMDITDPMTVRCYELKISKSDFLSDAKKTFIGDFNYYVIPTELWMDVRGHVEPGIGVWVINDNGSISVKKKAKRKACEIPRGQVLIRILRALNRENIKHCEKSLSYRQTMKPVKDMIGASLEIGDVVEYRSDYYRVISIEYNKHKTEYSPSAIVIPIDANGKENLRDDESELSFRPSILRKLRVEDLLSLEHDGERQ